MGRAFSQDLRFRVVNAWRAGLSARQAGLRFGVSAATAVRWVNRAKSGPVDAYNIGRPRGSRLDAVNQFIFDMIENKKDITLNEMVVRLMEAQGLKISRSALSNWLRAQGYTFKKRPHMHWSRSVQTS